MKSFLLPVLLVVSAFAQDKADYWILPFTRLDSAAVGFAESLHATPTNETPVIQVHHPTNGTFKVLIRSEVVTNWTKVEPYMDTTTWILTPGIIDSGFYHQPKSDYTMNGTIVSNVIAFVTWKDKLTSTVVESTPLGYLTKRVTHESKEIETVSPVTWYGTNGPNYGTITNIFMTNNLILYTNTPGLYYQPRP